MVALILDTPLVSYHSEKDWCDLAKVERISARVIWIYDNSCKNYASENVPVCEIALNFVPAEVLFKTIVKFSVLSVPLNVLSKIFRA
jgi:hypothetical protein